MDSQEDQGPETPKSFQAKIMEITQPALITSLENSRTLATHSAQMLEMQQAIPKAHGVASETKNQTAGLTEVIIKLTQSMSSGSSQEQPKKSPRRDVDQTSVHSSWTSSNRDSLPQNLDIKHNGCSITIIPSSKALLNTTVCTRPS